LKTRKQEKKYSAGLNSPTLENMKNHICLLRPDFHPATERVLDRSGSISDRYLDLNKHQDTMK